MQGTAFLLIQLQTQGPSTDKTGQDNSSNMLGSSSGSAPLEHRHTQKHSFPSGRKCQLIWPDLAKSCCAGRSPGWIWEEAPWHAVMEVAAGLEVGVLLSHQHTQITTCTGDVSLPILHPDPATQQQGVFWVLSGHKNEVHSE